MERLPKPKDQSQKKGATMQRQSAPAQVPTTQSDSILQLQSTLGNRRVSQMAQAQRLPSLQRTHRPLIQRFGTKEHALLGDEGTRGEQGQLRMVQLAPDYHLSYGEMTAMAGDYFGGIEEMRSLANAKSHKGVGTREELEYVRVCKVKVRPKDDDDAKAKASGFSSEVKKAVDKRYYALALNNRSHFSNPTVGDENLSIGEKAQGMNAQKRKEWITQYPLVQKNIPNAVSGYHQYHVQALFEAYYAGLEGKSVDQAMAAEAFGSHYLTDAFSAGHLRTTRSSINAHWNKRVPLFNHNLKGYIANIMAVKASPWYVSNDWAYNMDNPLAKGALATVSQKIDAKGGITFGDVVSGALHDYDNEKGVEASIMGEDVRLYGDGNLKKGETKDRALMAVNAGMQDILMAWEAGQKQGDPVVLASDLLYDGLFLAESLLPSVKPDSQVKAQDQRVRWDYDTLDELLGPKSKFPEALKIFAKEQAKEFESVANELDADQKKVFMKEIVDRLRAEPMKVVWEIIDWVPDTGGGVGGHNQDDNALEYLEMADKKNALHTLTVPQKIKILRFIFDGYTSGYDERMLMKMINAKPSDVPQLVQALGWGEMEDELGSAFSKKYPKSMFAAKTK